jgi:hypothetical protein
MKTILLSCIAILVLPALIGCCDDERHTTAASSSYESAAVDNKDMHPRHHQVNQ